MKEKDAVRKAFRDIPPELSDKLQAAEMKQVAEVKPDEPLTVISHYWPSCIDGSLRATCDGCKRHVSLSPSTQEMMQGRTAPTCILCMCCALSQMEAETKPGVIH